MEATVFVAAFTVEWYRLKRLFVKRSVMFDIACRVAEASFPVSPSKPSARFLDRPFWARQAARTYYSRRHKHGASVVTQAVSDLERRIQGWHLEVVSLGSR